jgi:hypothetical protein
MRDQIILGRNGELAVAVPLYRVQHEEQLGKLDGYIVSLTNSKPLAYILDMGLSSCPVLNSEIVEQQCDFLGDL